MKLKMNLIIVGALIVLVFSCNENKSTKNNTNNLSENNCIEKVLDKDSSLGRIRNHESEELSLSNTITNYVNGLRKINFKHCPSEFTQAFDKHIQAWIRMTTVTDKYPELRGEMHDLFKQIEIGSDSLEFKKRLDEIWNTWDEIEKIK